MDEKLDEILIVEDEPLIAEDVSETLIEAGYGIAGIAHSGEKALQILEECSPSLAVLDIQVDGGIQGLELAEIINTRFQIPFLFLTSFTDEATLSKVRALKPHGFIVKPFDDKELVTNVQLAITKFKEESNQLASFEKSSPSSAHFLKHNGTLKKVEVQDILYAQAFDNYCFVFTKEHKFLVPNTLKSVENKLDPSVFCRIHRSYLININAIDAIDDAHLVIHNTELPLSKTQRQHLLNRVSLL